MPFLLLDDATQEAQRRLQEFGNGLLQPLSGAAGAIGSTWQQAGETVQPSPQVVSPQDATQRLQDYGTSLLQPLSQQAPTIIQPQSGLQDITQRLQDHGSQVLDQAASAANQVTQLTPLNQPAPPPQMTQLAEEQPQAQPIGAQPAAPEVPVGGDLRDFARQAAQKAGIDPDIFLRQIQQESGFNPSAKSPAGAVGIAQFMPGTAAGLNLDPTDPYASLLAAAKEDASKLARYGGDWAKTLAAYNAGPGAVDKYGGVPPFAETQNYVKTILGGANPIQKAQDVVQGAQQAVQGVQQAASNVLPTLSQFGDKQLSAAEAYAACGPAAAVRFAEMMGRQPTLREAVDLASQVGWTAAGGMAGLGSESALFDKMGIAHRMVGGDWNALAKEAQSGNPVTISTPGHYFTADSYDPSSGAFHVGSSGTDLKGGSEWMTPSQMEARMGRLQGGMAVDNPQVPGASPLSQGVQAAPLVAENAVGAVQRAASDLTTQAGQAKDRGIQILNQAVDNVAQGAQQGVSAFTSPITAAGDFVKQQQETARQGYAQARLPTQEPLDFSKPLGPQVGVDPYGQIVEQGIPSIVRGVQTGDVGDIAGGALQTLLGAASALPGPGGATRAATEAAGPGILQTAGDLLRSRQSTLTNAQQGLGMLEDVLAQPGLANEARAPLEDLAMQQRAGVSDAAQAVADASSGAGRQLAQASPMFAARAAGALGGGLLGNVTTPPEANPLERALRIGSLATAGAAAPSLVDLATVRNPAIDQAILENLRAGGLNPNVYQSQGRGAIGTVVDLTKQGMLSNPVTSITNAIGNTIELLRSPAALALGGRPADAAAGMAAVGQAIPEAGLNAWRALRGNQLATLGQGASTTQRWEPVFRLLGAADMFTRTLGEYQGMAERGSQLLRDAGIKPSDPGVANFLANHAQELFDAGTQSGGRSVFQAVRDASSGLPFLDNMFRNYATWKEGMLNSPSLRDQALGAMADLQIPFAGVPTRMVQIGLGRLPPVTQATGAVRAIRALAQNDIPAAQRAIGETALESMIQAQIANGIREGNIVGPDDPDHPGGAMRVGGNWYNFNDLGGYALPMQIMAGFADAADKAGVAQPYDSKWDQLAAQAQAGFNASLKPFMQAVPGMQLVHSLAALGQSGLSGAAAQQAQDLLTRVTPASGLGSFIENLMDPVARDISKQGVQSLWEYPQSRIPGLAELLPVKIDPTTGQPMEKRRTGPGILVGQENPDVESAITQEANRLKKEGYNISAPKTYPQSVSIAGSEVKLKPDEQRAVTQITGTLLGNFADRLDSPGYQNATEDRKALMMQAYLNAADRARLSAVSQVLGRQELRARIQKGEKVAGRYVNAGAPEDFNFPFLSSSGLSADEQRQSYLGSLGAA